MEEAARQAGIPIEEVLARATEQMASLDALNYQLRLAGQDAIKKALDKLTELAGGEAREGKDFESTDLEAAKALAKFGIDALKLAKSGGAKEKDPDEQPDLFEAANPWNLKKVE